MLTASDRARTTALILTTQESLKRVQQRFGPVPKLRGPIWSDLMPRARLNYVGDLTDPTLRPYMTTKADASGRRVYIDEYPANGLGVRTTVPELKAGIRRMMDGYPVSRGPRVSYVNDDFRKPSPRVPIEADVAGLAAAGFLDSGLGSININSTTGGHRSNPNSAHNYGRAVDINRVNELNVGFTKGDGTLYSNPDPSARCAVSALQNALSRQPGIFESYGPDYLVRMPSRQPVTDPRLANMHKNHIHASIKRP